MTPIHYIARDLSRAPRPQGFVPEDEEAEMTSTFAPRGAVVEMILNGECESPSLVSGVLALETARLLGRLDSLRPSDAPWLARQ